MSTTRGGPARRGALAALLCAALAIPVAPAAAAPWTLYRTGAAGPGSYATLASAPATPSSVTSVRHGAATGVWLFRPGVSASTTTGWPAAAASGSGYATVDRLSGTIPAGTWTFRANITTDLPTGSADGHLLVAVYAVGEGNSRRLAVVEDDTNVLAAASTTATITVALPELVLSAEHLATEWYLVVSRNRAPAGSWTTALRHGGDTDTITLPGPAAPAPLSPPGTLTVQGTGDRTVELRWTASSDPRVVGYVVQRATSAAGPFVDVSGVLGATSYTDGGLSNGTRYYHRVVAVDGAGTRSPPSNTTSAVPLDTTAPAAPGTVTVTPAGSFRLAVSWEPSGSADVAGYEVQRAASAAGPFSVVAGPVAGTSVVDGGLPSGSTWYYRVVAIDDDGLRSAPTAPAPGTVAPSPPSGLRVVAVADGAVALAWDGTAEAVARYRIERATAAGGPFTEVGTTTGTSFTDTGLRNGTTYHYRVLAEDAAGGRSSPSAVVAAVPQDTGMPAPPTTLIATGQAGRRVQLDWSASPSSGVVGYRVFRSTGGAFTDISGLVAGLSFTDGPLPVGVRHRYHVRAQDASGALSIPSTEVSYTVPSSAPGRLRVTAVSETTASLAWDASNDPNATYRVLRATRQGGPYTAVSGRLTTTTFTDAGLVLGTAYYYVVQAEAADGTRSAPSNEVRVVPVNGPPTPPAGVVAVDTGVGGEIRVSWAVNPEPDVASYVVERATAPGGPWSTVAAPVVTTVLDQGLVDGQRYHYRVRAVDTAGLVSDPSATASAVPTDSLPPPTPAPPVVSVVGTDLRVQWAAVPTAVRYRVLRRAGDGPHGVVGETDGARTFLDTTVARGTSYRYAIVAVDAAGNASPPSPDSAPVVIPAASAPRSSTPTSGAVPPPPPPVFPGEEGPRSPPPLAAPPTAAPRTPPVAVDDGAPAPGASPGSGLVAGELEGDVLAVEDLPAPGGADVALRTRRFTEALTGTAAEVAENVGTVARTFRVPLLLILMLLLYLVVQRRLDQRAVLPMVVETGTSDDDDVFIL